MGRGEQYIEPDLSNFDPQSSNDILNMIKRVEGRPSDTFASVFSDCVCLAYENNPTILKDIDQGRTSATILKVFGESESPFVAAMFGCIAEAAREGHATVHPDDLDYVIRPEYLTPFAYKGSPLRASHINTAVQVFDYSQRPDKIDGDVRNISAILHLCPDLKAGSADVITRTLGGEKGEKLSVRALLDTLKVTGNAHMFHSTGFRPDAM